MDLAVDSALEKVRSQVAAEERSILATLMVVLNLNVAVREQALRDDQIVRLVAAGPLRSARNRGRTRCRSRGSARKSTIVQAGRARRQARWTRLIDSGRRKSRQSQERSIGPGPRARAAAEICPAATAVPERPRATVQSEWRGDSCNRGDVARAFAQATSANATAAPPAPRPNSAARDANSDAVGSGSRPADDVNGSGNQPERDGKAFDGQDDRGCGPPLPDARALIQRANLHLMCGSRPFEEPPCNARRFERRRLEQALDRREDRTTGSGRNSGRNVK